MYINQLYVKFHIYIDIIKYNSSLSDLHKLLNKIHHLNYGNYIIHFFYQDADYVLWKQLNSFISPFVNFINKKGNFQDLLLSHVSTLPPNDYVIVVNDVELLCETLMLEWNTLFLKEKKKLITKSHIKNSTNSNNKSDEQKIIWSCKCGLVNELILQIKKKNLTLNNVVNSLISICGIENIHKIGYLDYQTIVALNKHVQKNHILLATHKRTENLTDIFEMLCSQTEQNFCLHLLDNNCDEKEHNIIDKLIKKYSKKIEIILYRFHKNLHCFGRIDIIRKIINEHMLDFIIVFDDDQIYENNWISRMISEMKPLSTLSWYGKDFLDNDYWNSKIYYSALVKYKLTDITDFTYFGPGGSMMDIHLFLFNEIFHYIKYSKDIKEIDDIWLSFVFKKYLNIDFHRIFIHPVKTMETRNTWEKIKEKKNNLFNYLIDNFNWNVLEKKVHTYNVNSFCDKVYVLYDAKDNVKKIIDKFVERNICFHLKLINQNLDNTISTLKEQNKIIGFFHSTFVFDDFFHYMFDKKINELSKQQNDIIINDKFKIINFK